MVVEEGEQDRLAAAHGRAVQRVAGPPHIRRVGLEPAERPRRLPIRSGGELEPHEVPLQGPFVWRPPGVRAQDRRYLRRRPPGHFLLQRGGEVEHVGRGARGDPARVGHQGVEPAAAPVPDPPVDAGPRDPHRVAERADMLAFGQRPDPSAALLRGQLPVGGLADYAESRVIPSWVRAGVVCPGQRPACDEPLGIITGCPGRRGARRGVVSPGVGSDGCGAGQGLLLQGEVGVQVDLGGLDRFVDRVGLRSEVRVHVL